MKSVEVTRRNVTVDAFFASVEKACNRKGLTCDINRAEFENPSHPQNYRYDVIGEHQICYQDNNRFVHNKACAPGKAEVIRTLPWDMHLYYLGFDGSLYNLICEFQFDTDTKGTGYYFQAIKKEACQ